MRNLTLALLAIGLTGGGCGDIQVFAPAGIGAVGTVLNSVASGVGSAIGTFAGQVVANALFPLLDMGMDGAVDMGMAPTAG